MKMAISPFTEAYQVRKVMLGRCYVMRAHEKKWYYNVARPSKTTEKYELYIGIPENTWAALEEDWNTAHDSWGIDRDARINRVTEFGEDLRVIRTDRKYQVKDGSEWAMPKIFDSKGQLCDSNIAVGHGSVIRPTLLFRSTEKSGNHFMQVQPQSFQLIKLETFVGNYEAVEEEGAFVAHPKAAAQVEQSYESHPEF
jgi:hypothetical protein